MHTPWGNSDSQEQQAEGITFYGTPSHGGFKLSAQRLRDMPAELRAIQPWAGEGWYEEDCDYNIVVLAFPEHFTPHQRFNAVRCGSGGEGDGRSQFDKFFRTPAGSRLMAEYFEYLNKNQDKFELGSLGTSGKGWGFSATSLNRQRRMTGTCPGYPDLHSPFTEEEARAKCQNVVIESTEAQAA